MRSKSVAPCSLFKPMTHGGFTNLAFWIGSASDPTFHLCKFMQAKMPGSFASVVNMSRA
jgi:hypothetical protein